MGSQLKKKYSTPEEYLKAQKEMSKDWPSRHRGFVAWDGEGIGDGTDHRYVLMVNSEGDALFESERGQGIDTQKALRFLLDGKEKYPNDIHVMYGMNYDVNMILNGTGRQVPFKHLKTLMRNKRVYWRNFEIQYIPRRYFIVSEYEKVYGDKRGMKPFRSITIWDALSFFQQSFVDALVGVLNYHELIEDVEMDVIVYGKLHRGEFTYENMDTEKDVNMVSYCSAEVGALKKLMEVFRDDCKESGIQLRRYDGAGAAAAALMGSYNVPGLISKGLHMLSPELETALQVAYGGGRSEMFKFGHTDEVIHHYDIDGAFPSVMPDLYDISHGEWKHFDDYFVSTPGELALYKVYWDFRYVLDVNEKRHRRNDFDVMFPFFYRTPWQEPRIFYPPQGYSWVWAPELAAAEKHRRYLQGEIQILEQWKFFPSDDYKPFAFVTDMYAKRQEYKRQGKDGQALALKLALNAIPGKMAQSVGYRRMHAGDESRGRPPFFNLVYPGYITSAIRAKVFDACMQNPRAIIAVATDGIWSTAPLNLDVGDNLGQWKYEKLKGFTSVQAGIYFTRKEEGNVFHYRGFNQGSISEEKVIQAWADRAYSIKVPTRRFITMGTALASEETYNEKWCSWDTSERSLQIQPNQMLKRQIMLEKDGLPPAEAATSLIDTYASDVMMFTENVKQFGEKDKHGVSLEEYLSKKHKLPWDDPTPKSDIERFIEEQEAIAHEITDSDM